jgi:PleD family two-component response regulator
MDPLHPRRTASTSRLGAARCTSDRQDTSVLALVIDDSRAMRMILKRHLLDLGFEVVEAATAGRRSRWWPQDRCRTSPRSTGTCRS